MGIMVPIVAIVMPVVLVGVILTYRYHYWRLIHEQRMAMIEKGMDPSDLTSQEVKNAYDVGVVGNRQRMLYSGTITTFIGVALLIGLGSIGRGQLLLGGLIPLAVGLGQLIFYVATQPKQHDANSPEE